MGMGYGRSLCSHGPREVTERRALEYKLLDLVKLVSEGVVTPFDAVLFRSRVARLKSSFKPCGFDQ